ncbi:MAG: hypothetical protein IJX28_05085 [Clostridia bacterium]|nr:hypothetical protein [Clostridia bacterium]
MKKLCYFCLILALPLIFFGCQKDSNVPEEETLPKWETVVLEDREYLYGEIIEIQMPDVLVLKLSSPNSELGDTVYVVTHEAGEWCVGDDVYVTYSKTQYNSNNPDSKRILADRVETPDYNAKPILYFYPEAPTVCSAKVVLNGELTCTYPAHGTEGWKDFVAHPDGTLIFPDGKSYYALYWEGVQYADWDFSKGFCVRGEDTATFLAWALAEQGLTAREANEFIIYWLPLMQDNPYNVISFQTTAYTDGATLEITPAPDRLLRVFMAYYPTETAVEIPPQSFEGFERQGFTVVEWGGCQVKEP